MDNQQTTSQQILVWWALWAAFQTGIFFIFFILGRPGKPATTADVLPWMAGMIPFLLSILVRWQLLPRIGNPQKALSCLVIGIALAEATTFFGIFLIPSHKTELFIFSALGIFQFIPVYARRVLENAEPE
jgi:hypothetical protein